MPGIAAPPPNGANALDIATTTGSMMPSIAWSYMMVMPRDVVVLQLRAHIEFLQALQSRHDVEIRTQHAVFDLARWPAFSSAARTAPTACVSAALLAEGFDLHFAAARGPAAAALAARRHRCQLCRECRGTRPASPDLPRSSSRPALACDLTAADRAARSSGVRMPVSLPFCFFWNAFTAAIARSPNSPVTPAIVIAGPDQVGLDGEPLGDRHRRIGVAQCGIGLGGFGRRLFLRRVARGLFGRLRCRFFSGFCRGLFGRFHCGFGFRLCRGLRLRLRCGRRSGLGLRFGRLRGSGQANDQAQGRQQTCNNGNAHDTGSLRSPTKQEPGLDDRAREAYARDALCNGWSGIKRC